MSEPRHHARRVVLAVGATLTLLTVSGAAALGALSGDDAYSAEVGNCLRLASVAPGAGEDGAGEVRRAADFARAPCSDARAVHQVLTHVAGRDAPCPVGDYISHAEGSRTLCLGYNVTAGDCFADSPTQPRLVPCTEAATEPTLRVLRVVDNRATPKVCRPTPGGDVVALTYAVPARTLCITHLPLVAAAR